jgi:catechol 2,3-dioxygenase-like lactoylglutathione lyase family enzyme
MEETVATFAERLAPFGRIAQIGIVVRDLDRGVAAYSALLGLTDWKGYTYGPALLRDATYRGQAGTYSMRIALSGADPVVELVEPVDGPSIYDEWLAEHGEGLHHVGVEVPSIADAVARARAAGYDVMQSGRGYGLEGDGGFAYLDTFADLRIIVELLEFPARRRPPETTWDAASEEAA